MPSHRAPAPGAVRTKHLAVIAVVLAALAGVTVVVHRQTDDKILIGYWWFGALVISGCLVAFVVGRRYTQLPIAPGRVLCIIPSYNEDQPNLAGCVQSILEQTVDVDVEVIDDGSARPVLPFHHPRVTWRRQPNKGKRGAQVEVLKAHGVWDPEARKWRKGVYDYVLTVDGDSRPMPDATEHLLRAMSDPKVQAATGMIYIKNYGSSLIARAADIDIGTSCVMMRASRSVMGCLETTSGALAMYPAELLYDHLEEYEVECGTGDDRWLALRALERGHVVGVAEALVETDMPVTVRDTYKQRLRWARSWWWMLPYVFANLRWHQLISPTYGMLQLLIAPLMAGWAAWGVLAGLVSGHNRYGGTAGVLALAVYLGAYVIVRWGLSGLYLIGRPNMPAREKWKSFLIGTPAAILLNVLLLTPTRYWALRHLRNAQWSNRKTKAAPVNEHLGHHDPEATPTLVMPVQRDLLNRPVTAPPAPVPARQPLQPAGPVEPYTVPPGWAAGGRNNLGWPVITPQAPRW